MIKIQARIGVGPHTIAICLVYSMQAPGLPVPGLRECEGQGLFTFSPGLRQHAHTLWLQRRAHTQVAVCFTSNLRELPVCSP